MRITQVLCRQHLGRWQKLLWANRSKRVILPFDGEEILASHGIKVVDAMEVIDPPKPKLPRIEVNWLWPQTLPRDNTHPEWNERPCYKYEDKCLLVEGLDQAQPLLKTVIIHELPEKLISLEEELNPKMQNLIERSIYSSHVFDAWQEKLPKVIDPLRPQINQPRVYGIPDARKLHNLLQKLFHICELMSNPVIGYQRKILEDAHLRTYIERDNDLMYFQSIFNLMITSPKPLAPITLNDDFKNHPIPDIHPLDPMIGLKQDYFYTIKDHYPISKESQWVNPHTIVVNYEADKVKNLTELPVTEEQAIARSLVKCFATAACFAKQKFGEGVVDVPEPVTIQCIQSNGQWFDFSVFQLNTLDISSKSGKKNVWWLQPRMELFSKAGYFVGRPEVHNVNPEVFKKILAFYRHC